MKKLILSISFLLLTSTSFANNSGPNELRDNMQNKCGADFSKLCSKVKDEIEMHKCITTNKDQFSKDCKEFLTKLQILIQKPSK